MCPVDIYTWVRGLLFSRSCLSADSYKLIYIYNNNNEQAQIQAAADRLVRLGSMNVRNWDIRLLVSSLV